MPELREAASGLNDCLMKRQKILTDGDTAGSKKCTRLNWVFPRILHAVRDLVIGRISKYVSFVVPSLVTEVITRGHQLLTVAVATTVAGRGVIQVPTGRVIISDPMPAAIMEKRTSNKNVFHRLKGTETQAVLVLVAPPRVEEDLHPLLNASDLVQLLLRHRD